MLSFRSRRAARLASQNQVNNMQDLSNSGVPDIHENNLPDHVHQISTWVEPKQTHTAPSPQASSYDEAMGGETLPLGWREGTAPDGQVYYINNNLQKTQLERPLPMI